MQDELIQLLAGRRGHFRMESGYHSEEWFDLARVLERKERLRPAIVELGRRLQSHAIDAVCGPVVGGAELAGMIGADLALPVFRAERVETDQAGLFPVKYRIAPAERARVRGKRVAVVDDAISAGSAVRGTCDDLIGCGAQPVVLGALYVFGDRAGEFAAEHGLALEAIARKGFGMWKPEQCPLCRAGVPVEAVSDANPRK